MAFGSTPLSTTVLGTNEFPASSVYIQGTAGGNFTAVQGGPASSADASGNISAPMAVYTPDGNDVALGTTTDLSSANTLIGLAKAIKANTASVVIGSGTITANIGTTGGLALDTSINGILLSQGSATSGEKGPLVQGAVTTSAPTYTTAQTSPLSLTTAGALRVDASATTQPVSGTITANAGSGTFNIQANASVNLNQVGGSAITLGSKTSANSLPVVVASDQGAVPVSGTFWQATQPVSGTITANAGTGTFNNQQSNITADYDTGAGTQTMTMFGLALPASGGAVAGGTSSNPIQVSLANTGANSTAVKVDGSAVTQPVSGTITANAGTGNFNDASVGATASAVPADATYIGGNKSGNLVGLSLDTNGNLNVNVAAGGGSGGTSSSFNAAFPATGTAAGASDGTNMKPLLVDASGFLKVNVAAGGGSGGTSSSFGAAFPATGTAAGWSDGTNMQGPRVFDADTGAGTQYVAGVNVRISANAGSIEAKGQQTMANSLPVAIASDQGAVPASQSGSWTVTANAGTNLNTSLLALESGGNLAILAGGVAGSKYQTNLAQVGGSNVVTAATGVQKVGIVGSAGATLDSTVGAGTAPTNALITGTVYNSSAPAPTNGQAMAVQADQAGNLRTFPGLALLALAAWSSATSLNATQTIFTNSGAPAVLVQLTQTTTITAGAITFEVSYDGSTWVTVTASQVLDPTSSTYAQIALPYTLQASTNKYFLISNNGWQGLRIKLSTQITGTGTVTPNYALLAYDPIDSAIVYSPTAANFQVTATQGGAPWSENITQFGSSAVVTGTGTGGAGIPRVTVSSDSTVGANSATGSAVPANAFYQGGNAATALPTAATGGNLTGLMVDKYGRMVAMGGLRELKGTQHTTITSTVSETTIVTAGGASVFCDLYCLIINNSSATACNVTIKDSTAGTTRFVFSVPAGDVRGFSLPQDSAHPQSGANANWTATCSASVASIDITALFVNNK